VGLGAVIASGDGSTLGVRRNGVSEFCHPVGAPCPFSPHQLIERREIRPFATLGKESRRVHGGEFFRNRRCHKLIDADAFCFGALFNFCFHRAGKTKGVGALRRFHVHILRYNSAGDITSDAELCGRVIKIRLLNATMTSAWPFTNETKSVASWTESC
jgi:hypothetical protein